MSSSVDGIFETDVTKTLEKLSDEGDLGFVGISEDGFWML